MPIVPYRADLGLQQDTNYAKPDLDAHLAQAKSFERIGKDVMVTGQVVAQVANAYAKDREQMEQNEAQLTAKQSGLRNVVEAASQAEGSEDPKAFYAYRDKLNADAKKKYLEKYKDNPARAAKLELAFDQAISATEQFANSTYLDHLKKKETAIWEGHQNFMKDAVRTNPGNLNELKNVFLDSVAKSNNLNKTSAIKATFREMATTAYQTYLENGHYDDAARVVRENRVFLDDPNKMSLAIGEQKKKDKAVDRAASDSKEKQDQLALKQEQSGNFKNFLKSTSDRKEPLSPEQLKAELGHLDDQFTAQSINLDQHIVARKMLLGQGDQNIDDSLTVLELQDMLSKKNFDGFEQKVGAAVEQGRLKPATAANYLSTVYNNKSNGATKYESHDSNFEKRLEEVGYLVGKIPYKKERRFEKLYSEEDAHTIHKIQMDARDFNTNGVNGKKISGEEAIQMALTKNGIPRYPEGVTFKGATVDEKMNEFRSRYGVIADDKGKAKFTRKLTPQEGAELDAGIKALQLEKRYFEKHHIDKRPR